MMKIKNLYEIEGLETIPGKEIFEDILKTRKFRVERIMSIGNCPSQDWMVQDWSELVFLLKGDATLEFADNRIVEMQEGDYCFIPKQLAHRVVRTNNLQTIWLAIHYEES